MMGVVAGKLAKIFIDGVISGKDFPTFKSKI